MKLKYNYKEENITEEQLENDKYIQDFMIKNGYKKIAKDKYVSIKSTIDPSEILIAIYWSLTDKQWFVQNIDEFKLYYDDDNKDEEDIMKKISKFINKNEEKIQ